MTDLPTYVLERVFDASPELVWRTWTEAELLSQWYGPGVETVIHKLDVTPGGVWLNEMRMSKGSSFEKAEYSEVKPFERLVWRHTITDNDWQPAANPMMPDWPRHLMTTVTFAPKGDKTHMRLEWVPDGATEAELACFKGAMAGLDHGWGAGMDMLAQILADLQS
ncbi:SRPBCC family protein [Aliiroseovarius sp. 2305UL8-7]|uniref:SRPBCC family protein n=1 Tax=Aliiroseovarius conchicola TaxID=3121637 RepID=UPI0035295A8C